MQVYISPQLPRRMFSLKHLLGMLLAGGNLESACGLWDSGIFFQGCLTECLRILIELVYVWISGID